MQARSAERHQRPVTVHRRAGVSHPASDRRFTQRWISAAPGAPGNGVGLANLRERLAALYGAQGLFTLASEPPDGRFAV